MQIMFSIATVCGSPDAKEYSKRLREAPDTRDALEIYVKRHHRRGTRQREIRAS